MKLAHLSIPVLALALCHCAGLQMPATPSIPAVPGAASLTQAPGLPGSPAAPGAATETAKPSDASKPAAKSPEAAKAYVPTTVEIHSDCSKTVSVFYGEKPKFGSGRKSSVSSNSTGSEGRNADGTLTIWIIDEKENGLSNVKVTPDTKRVTIGASCKDISAK
jgi:hypothetical protein